jgi:hypothetical protein
MADKFTRFLGGAASGITNPKGNLGDWRHASRVFAQNTFALAPKTKFSYHVFFEFDQNAIAMALQFAAKHKLEAGLLVKTVDLPKVTIETDIKNQYNRKKIVYKNINYDPVNITMHDDNVGVTNALFALYNGYYSNDRFNKPEAWMEARGPYRPINESNAFRYGLDVDTVNEQPPFFKSITIYTMGRQRFVSYKLVNPHIANWSHGNVSYAESNGTMESVMTLNYEAVIYGAGKVTKGDQGEPKGFGSFKYDVTPSPLSIFGGTTTTLFGPGGLLAGATNVLADAKTIFGDNYADPLASGGDFLSTAIGALNVAKSLGQINSRTLAAEAQSILLNPGSSISGLRGINISREGSPNAPI